MNRKKVCGIILTLLLTSILTLASNIQQVEASLRVHNIDTRLDYATIQGAIDAPETEDAHTIFVEDGIYYEQVRVHKSLTLCGENRATTIIDGGGRRGMGAFYINADNVTITSFTERNSDYGINIYSSYITLRDNNMTGNKANLSVKGLSEYYPGDYLSYFIHDIDKSNVVDGKPVYYLVHQKDLTLDSSSHPDIGYLALVNSTNITVRNLTIRNNGEGVLLAYVTNSTIESNVLTDNVYGVHLKYSTFINVTNNKILDNDFGIRVWDVWGHEGHNTIKKNFVSNNPYAGIVVWYTYWNDIINNTATNNGWKYQYNWPNFGGISLRFSGGGNVARNICINNSCGIYNLWSGSFVVSKNVLKDNAWGIYLERWSIGNTYYHNNFINNTEQVHIHENFNDVWDDGYPSGGNYWSDYSTRYPDATEIDDSGIWDTPYAIDVNNQDNYPLMEPWTPKPTTPIEASEELIETIESWNLVEGTENSLTSKLDEVIHLLEKGNDNGALHKLMDFIDQVEGLKGKKLTDEQADYLIAEAQRIIDLIQG